MTSPVTSAHLMDLFRRPDSGVTERIEAGIRQNRQGRLILRFEDAEGRPAEGVRCTVRQTGHDFLFGANLFMLDGFDTGEKNRAYERAFLDVFNSGVIPFYWSDLEPRRGQMRFAAGSVRIPRRPPPDAVLAFCEQHGLVPKGHCLVWHQWVPKWLPENQDAAALLLEERILAIGRRYGQRIPLWDVVNEPMEKHLFPKMTSFPADYVKEAFDAAETALPSSAKCFLNEATAFSWREFHGETTGLRLLVENLLLKGAKIDGIGLQYHLFFYDRSGLATSVRHLAENRDVHLNPQRLLDVLDLHARLGLPVHISEITLPTYSDIDDAEDFQADMLRELYRLWFSHAAVEGIYWWNLADGGGHGRESELRAGLLRADLSPKPSYAMLRRLIREEWTTAFTVAPEGAEHAFDGFYGDYEITTEWRGARLTLRVGLHHDTPREIILPVVGTHSAGYAGETEKTAAETLFT